MNDNDTSLEESLEEDTRTANSNLVRLIEAVGALLSASTDVLTRVQGILGRIEPRPDIVSDMGRNARSEERRRPPVDPTA